MSYRDKLRPGKRINAFYLESDSDIEEVEGLQSPDSKRVYLYEWDNTSQKVVGKWVTQENQNEIE